MTMNQPQRIPIASMHNAATTATHPNMMVGGVDGCSGRIYNKLKE